MKGDEPFLFVFVFVEKAVEDTRDCERFLNARHAKSERSDFARHKIIHALNDRLAGA